MGDDEANVGTPMGPTPMAPPSQQQQSNIKSIAHSHQKQQAPKSSPKIHKFKSMFSRKKSKEPKHNKKDNKKAVFGVNPTKLSATMILEKGYGSPIPDILVKLKTELFLHKGHLIEGIFRIAPNHEECKQIEDRLNDGQLLNINFGAIDGDLIANLIKLWYRELPMPVLQSLIKTNKIETCKTKENVGAIVSNDISEPNKSYFLWLLDLCVETIEHIAINKMGVRAMAVVMSQNTFNPSDFLNPLEAMKFSGAIVKFMMLAIEWRQTHSK